MEQINVQLDQAQAFDQLIKAGLPEGGDGCPDCDTDKSAHEFDGFTEDDPCL